MIPSFLVLLLHQFLVLLLHRFLVLLLHQFLVMYNQVWMPSTSPLRWLLGLTC